MMDSLRKSVSGWTGKIVLGLLLGVFAVAWTLADGFSGRMTSDTVMTVGGTSVSIQDYRVAYQQNIARVSQQIQRRPTPEEAAAFGVDQSTLSQLSTGALLDEQGRVLGLGLSEDGLLRLIADDPAFHDANGNFSRNNFRFILQNAGLSEAAYIERLGETALRGQIVQAVTQGFTAPQALDQALGLYIGERRTVRYVTLQPEPAGEIADPTEEQLTDYFGSESSRYAAPEYRSFTYVNLTADAVLDPGAVTDEEIQAYYEENREDFTAPERRRVRQIVFPDNASAEAALERLGEGETFEEVAASAGRSPEDIDLGFLSRAELPDANLADAAFSLSPNEPSAVIAGIFGPTVVEVTEIEPEGIAPLDDVREDIRREVAEDRAHEGVNVAYDTFENVRATGATLEEAAEQAGLEIETATNVAADGSLMEGGEAELPAQGDLLEAVFEAEPDFDNLPLNYDSGAFLFYDVTDVTPARERTLDEVREAVVADWKNREAQLLLDERAQALSERVEGGETLEAVAEAEGFTVERQERRTRGELRGVLGDAASQATFSGASGLVTVAPYGQNRLLLVVDEAFAPAEPVAELPQGQSEQIADAIGNDVLQAYVGLLGQEYPVRFNQAAVQNAQGQVR